MAAEHYRSDRIKVNGKGDYNYLSVQTGRKVRQAYKKTREEEGI